MEPHREATAKPKSRPPLLTAGRVPDRSGRRLTSPAEVDACFFRSGPKQGRRKALLKITDRCDLRCAHCFVSATKAGSHMPLDVLKTHGVPRLLEARVANVTLTGGEPLVHPELVELVETLTQANLDVTLCTNGVAVTQDLIKALRRLHRVRVNVSLDGFSDSSHGRFRGNRDSFQLTLQHARDLAEAGLLKGILCTPNRLAEVSEYIDLYEFARDLGVDYVLMNPLSHFGRGVVSARRLRADSATMRLIQSEIPMRTPSDPEAVFIRFPNDERPLSGCIAGDIFYVFVNGEAAVCPYLVFAADTPRSQHGREEFIFGNLFKDDDFAQRLANYRFHERYSVGTNAKCGACSMSSGCGKGCPAAVIADGGRIGDLDSEVCPVAS